MNTIGYDFNISIGGQIIEGKSSIFPDIESNEQIDTEPNKYLYGKSFEIDVTTCDDSIDTCLNMFEYYMNRNNTFYFRNQICKIVAKPNSKQLQQFKTLKYGQLIESQLN